MKMLNISCVVLTISYYDTPRGTTLKIALETLPDITD